MMSLPLRLTKYSPCNPDFPKVLEWIKAHDANTHSREVMLEHSTVKRYILEISFTYDEDGLLFMLTYPEMCA